jgi:hypothetical protein
MAWMPERNCVFPARSGCGIRPGRTVQRRRIPDGRIRCIYLTRLERNGLDLRVIPWLIRISFRYASYLGSARTANLRAWRSQRLSFREDDRGLHVPRAQLVIHLERAGFAVPWCRFVELVVFAYVEVARAFYLAATGWERSVAPPHHGESSTRRAGGGGDPRQNRCSQDGRAATPTISWVPPQGAAFALVGGK